MFLNCIIYYLGDYIYIDPESYLGATALPVQITLLATYLEGFKRGCTTVRVRVVIQRYVSLQLLQEFYRRNLQTVFRASIL
jgi:hypothetical protein